jgi:transglutaminase-like putative cysteine protease
MRLRVRHTSSFEYEAPVHASYNEARISPIDTASQFTLEHRVEVTPPANLYRYRDYWGTRVHAFDLHEEHTTLQVVGSSVVETAEHTPSLDAEAGGEAIGTSGLTDRLYEYLMDTAITAPDAAVLDAAGQLRSAATPATAVSLLGTWLRERIEYEPGVTSVATTAPEVLQAGRGVCQDYVHLALAILRAIGIPARYASGYLYPEGEESRGVTHEGASHAWLEAWVGNWHPFDPTSGAAVAERHVLVARGRDYSDVPPLKGVYHGGASHRLQVVVELTRVA